MYDYLNYFDTLYQTKHVIKVLHLYSIQLLLKSLFLTRRYTTSREDLEFFAKMIIVEESPKLNDQEYRVLQSIKNEK